MASDYPEVRMPQHPRAKKNGRVYAHILAAEELLGRPLKAGEVVHHIDHNKLNYSKDNLMIFLSQEDHARFHQTNECVETDESNVYTTRAPSKFCSCCNKPLTKSKTGLCGSCYAFTNRKVLRPSKEDLQLLLDNNTYVAIGKMYGVSDNTVRKWKKQYDIRP